ncbi:uncharacterized protein RHOBADRAFT_31282 [Rhodotorula graminis WP1]|uniref:NADH:flavin oxidoreductase/NADH oxidase N-terminal domain-containing protein n=1 Tax=Rhodotorula graminis (strain WP1) TaxID=578459 RepID=A0A194SAX0_RHOGW|nr:uncharacterized protein RHOBADRAFT_31282 [Rhodotorula graminis WP1]KPV77739.1 hypothetical protein RHOBADRAFT_31282 [Rhodotorula graminis WP1]
MAANTVLFEPLKLGRLELSSRIVMAPLTRYRADDQHVHHEHAVEYYAQRASYPGTLLITEATYVSQKAGGQSNAPGCYTDEQVAAWKRIVDAVHAKGSYIYLQLWALGRAAEADELKKDAGEEVHSASDVAFEGGDKPRPLTKQEIQDYVAAYAYTAKRFVEEAGGDGCEVHGANGKYSSLSFIQTNSNKRTDEYGGSVENRCRFPLDVMRAVTDAIGADRTGIRLSPWSKFQGMKMDRTDDIKETFSYLVTELRQRHPDLAYVHGIESRVAGNETVDVSYDEQLDFIHDIWAPRTFLQAGGFTPDTAVDAARKYENTAIVFGRLFLSTPDIVRRIKDGIELNKPDRDTFYVKGPNETKGYTDYPFAE